MNKSVLKEKLKSYSALASAVFGTAAAADAQVVYTDVNPDTTLTITNSTVNGYDVDFDNDGNTDMIVATYGYNSSSYGQFNISLDFIQQNETAALLGYMDSGYPYVSALASGVMVDPAATNWYDTTVFNNAQANNAFAAPSFSVVYGELATGADAYIGARFVIGTGTYYGWVRVQVASDVSSVIVKDYAYNATANTGLVTGQTGLGINEMPASVWFVGVSGKNITVSSKETGNLTVVDASGRVVATSKMENGLTVINLGDAAASGVYMVKFDNNGVMGTKKVVLY